VIWLTWRQQRTEALIAAFALALAAAVLIPTGLHMTSVYDHEGIGACLAHPTSSCRDSLDLFAGRWDALVNLVGWFNLLPILIGALLAAPFVLEFERGTVRLAWTQSITRGRWLTARLALIGVAAVAASLVLTLLMTWWRDPLDNVNGRMPDGFDLEGLAPSVYTLFAAALVIAIGVVLQRTAAAIGIAFVAFFVVRIGIATWARSHYEAAVHKTWNGGPTGELRDAWVLSQGHGFRVAHGGSVDPTIVDSCIKDASTRSVEAACLAQHHIVEFTYAVYQPDSRFWLFQGIEAVIFGALTLALIGFSVWWIRKRIS
jgi:ABC-type transport system involved in multi-copper enzyme maturation permease subunit